jgi:hypothetical protein
VIIEGLFALDAVQPEPEGRVPGAERIWGFRLAPWRWEHVRSFAGICRVPALVLSGFRWKMMGRREECFTDIRPVLFALLPA